MPLIDTIPVITKSQSEELETLGSSNSEAIEIQATDIPFLDHTEKRTRSQLVRSNGFSRHTENDSATSDCESPREAKRQKKNQEIPLKYILPPPLSYPKSLYEDIRPLGDIHSEKAILQDAHEDRVGDAEIDPDDGTFIEVDLDEFSIYRPHKQQVLIKSKKADEAPLANELISLHEVNEWGVNHLLFDGEICYGSQRRQVRSIPFEWLSIGAYGETDIPTVNSNIWIQSSQGTQSGIWYRLRNPAKEYSRYHQPFIWMADLAKHVVDYLFTHEAITLEHFRVSFHDWLRDLYPDEEKIQRWEAQYGDVDFRRIVVSQAKFLLCQAEQVTRKLLQHPIWHEAHPRFLDAVAEQKEKYTNADMFVISQERNESIRRRKTTVTPYVSECFKDLPWAKFLYSQDPIVGHQDSGATPSRTQAHCIAPSARIVGGFNAGGHCRPEEVKIGDVVTVPMDTFTSWRTNDGLWYGYVQSITHSQTGHALGLLWLYRPSDTQCLKMRYPHAQELFLSDHCNCGDTPIYAQEVVSRPLVAFFTGPKQAQSDFFDSDFECNCGKKTVAKYSAGNTLLAQIGRVLEPVVFVQHNPEGMDGNVKIRRLLRMARDYGHSEAAANELVFTKLLKIIPLASLKRPCSIRWYTLDQRRHCKIPAPYDRHGTGDCYYITSQDLTEDRPIKAPLRGLNIFCGGGSFGRGLEEGGVVEFTHAVDWYNEAIHTKKANLRSPEGTQLFRGSVNDYLTQAMQGKGHLVVAQRSQVDCIAAGSPCQGFSLANIVRGNDRGLFNVSMVASVVAFIDFYRPKYALLENVKGMAMGSDRDNTLAQVICALVGLGYQVRTFGLDAWNFGSPQRRSRVFVSIAAPGLTPLPEPPRTHSRPEGIMSASLGKTPNGMSTSSRYSTKTPFEYVSIREATCDLPRTDARTTCIKFPDHRMSRPMSTANRVLTSCVPKYPAARSFISAYQQGYMPEHQTKNWSWDSSIRNRKDSRSYQRVKANLLMPTILTKAQPHDGLNGNCIHWEDDRTLTIMEARRGQGYPDDEVLVGLPHEQWKIIGDSVDRHVALALGMSLRSAWLANDPRTEAKAADLEGWSIERQAKVKMVLTSTKVDIQESEVATASTRIPYPGIPRVKGQALDDLMLGVKTLPGIARIITSPTENIPESSIRALQSVSTDQSQIDQADAFDLMDIEFDELGFDALDFGSPNGEHSHDLHRVIEHPCIDELDNQRAVTCEHHSQPAVPDQTQTTMSTKSKRITTREVIVSTTTVARTTPFHRKPSSTNEHRGSHLRKISNM